MGLILLLLLSAVLSFLVLYFKVIYYGVLTISCLLAAIITIKNDGFSWKAIGFLLMAIAMAFVTFSEKESIESIIYNKERTNIDFKNNIICDKITWK